MTKRMKCIGSLATAETKKPMLRSIYDPQVAIFYSDTQPHVVKGIDLCQKVVALKFKLPKSFQHM